MRLEFNGPWEGKPGTDGEMVLEVKGEVHFENVHLFRQQLNRLELRSTGKVVLDLSGVTCMFSGGYMLIRHFERNLKRMGAEVVLVHSEHTKYFVELCGLREDIPAAPSTAAGLWGLKSAEELAIAG